MVPARSNEFDPPHREHYHFDQEPPVLPTLDVGLSVLALAVPDWQVKHLEIAFRSAKNEIEISERVQPAEVGTVRGDDLILLPSQHLRAAQRILDLLAQK